MTEKVWMGAIFLKDEGGYEIVLKSLEHYRRRLRTLSKSPELKDSAAMFASVLNQQAMKTVPKIDELVEKIKNNINDIQAVKELSDEVSFFEKALMCYESDIEKAENTGHDYFVNLVGDLGAAKKDIDTIKIALKKIKEYSE
ncbi:MAG: hypothetical protein EA443_06060 [Nitrosopumilus sp.]|jgi:hypothetical protein|nr:MAG: hypothetical protein EA443_06060 [Nitrosopumilus sp.]